MEKFIEVYNYIQPALFFIITGVIVFLALVFRKKWVIYGSALLKIVSNILSTSGFKIPKEFTNIQKKVENVLANLSKLGLEDDYYKVKVEVKKMLEEELEQTVEEYLNSINDNLDHGDLSDLSNDLYKAAFYTFLEDAFDHIFDFAWEKSGRELPKIG